MKTTISLLLASLILVAGQTYAEQGRQRHRDHQPRQHNQKERIQQGVRSGELTREEVQGLREDRQAIRQEAREYRSDGKLTKEERKDLHQDMNALSKEIYQEKHDGDARPKAAK